MKTKNFILFLTFICCYSVYSKEIPGYIFDKDTIKRDVVFNVKMDFFAGEPNYVKLQTSVSYLQGDEFVDLYPEDCIKIGFLFPDGVVELVSVPNKYSEETKISGKNLFLRPKILGPVSLYYFYYIAHTTGSSVNGGTFTSSSMVNGWILQNELGPYKVLNHGNGKIEEYVKLFFDYSDLCMKIESKQINKRDLELMVKTYNKWKILQANNIMENSSNK